MTISFSCQPICGLTGDLKKCFPSPPPSSKRMVTFHSSKHIRIDIRVLKSCSGGFGSVRYLIMKLMYDVSFGLDIGSDYVCYLSYLLLALLHQFSCLCLHLSLDFLCCNLCQSFIMRIEFPWQPVAPGTIDRQGSADISSTVDLHSPSFKSSQGECIYRVPLTNRCATICSPDDKRHAANQSKDN